MTLNNPKQLISTNSIHDALSTSIIALDNDLKISHINIAAENLFGQSRQQVMGQFYTALFKDEVIQKHIEFVIQNEEPQTLKECSLHAKFYQSITVDCVSSPLFKKGVLQGVVLEFSQIDHQMRLSREEHLLMQQEATQSLLRSMAHEIKNPLGGLRGAAQLLEMELESEVLKEYTHIIISEADRLTNLVDRMLGARQPSQFKNINIHEVLEHVCKLMLSDIPDAVQMHFDYDPSIPDLYADRDQLIQLVLNVAGNALKAVGNTGNISFHTRVLRHYTINQITHRLALRLDIIDDGIGVPLDIQDKLFYPMISGSAEGSGLGLSIAQSLAHKHNGVIEFESVHGKTCFTILLPLEKGNIDSQKQEAKHG